MPVSIRRKKKRFARNRFREQEAGSIFSKTSNGLMNAFGIIIAIFFTPALITSSLLSKEILLPFANIFLSLGYLSNFFYRIYKREMSKAELIVSLLILSALITAALIFFPPVVALSTLSVIQLVNQIAVVINMFFMIRHVIVPPVKHFVEKIAHHLGFDISGQYYSKPELTLEKDRFVIDSILEKDYGHDSHSPHYNPAQLTNLNKLLTKLTNYVCKYDEAVFGYIKNKDKIEAFEKMIDDLTVHGDSDSSYGLINNKIRFKTTKIQLLQDAVNKVNQALEDPGNHEIEALSFFHKPLFHNTHNNLEVLQAGLDNLQDEIMRQQSKKVSLQECLPLPQALTMSFIPT